MGGFGELLLCGVYPRVQTGNTLLVLRLSIANRSSLLAAIIFIVLDCQYTVLPAPRWNSGSGQRANGLQAFCVVAYSVGVPAPNNGDVIDPLLPPSNIAFQVGV